MANSVFIFDPGNKYRREAQEMKSFANRLVKAAKATNVSFETYLISNSEMKKLNLKFRRKNKTTNILSFNADRGSIRPDLKTHTLFKGEIFLAPDYIRSQRESLNFLFIHGFLHLLGYTHSGKRDTIKMEKLEDKLSKKLNV